MKDERSSEVAGDDRDQRLDQATAVRLAKLRTMPVDTSRLDAMLRAEIGERPDRATSQPRSPMRIEWSRSIGRWAAAAAVLLAAVVAASLLLLTPGNQALASATQMAQVHEDLVAGRMPVVQVDSIEQAGRELTKQWPQSPGLPELPNDHVMACCMKSVKDKKMACVLLRTEGVPVTMAVARAQDMRLPSSPTRAHAGVTYHVQSSGKLNMVMTERADRWVCLIGELPADRLMDIAEQLRF